MSQNAYKDAGVDTQAGADLVTALKPHVKKTMRSGVMTGLGGFGALFDLKDTGYTDPILVSGTDGVGTKIKIAIDTKQHQHIGIDAVAMCVNDIIVQGAEPLFFMDYFATGHLDNTVAETVIAGIAKGCAESGCALIGGETAEMPGLYADGDYDIAGFTVGAVERTQLITGEHIKEGDIILGLASSGVHSNGFSLVRKIIETQGLSFDSPAPFAEDQTLAEALLTPTKLYVKPILEALKHKDEEGNTAIHGMAHITGGGLIENIPRVIPEGLTADIDMTTWNLPPVFQWLAEAGGLSNEDLSGTFNCGIGMLVIVDAAHAQTLQTGLEDAGETVFTIGDIIKRTDSDTALRLTYQDTPMTRPKRNLAVFISGRGTNLQSIIDACKQPNFPAQIALVISNVDDAHGLTRASEARIPTRIIPHKDYDNKQEFETALLDAIKPYDIDLVCLAGFMRIVTPHLINGITQQCGPNRLINIHPSLLPDYKGLNTHARALADGKIEAGCTIHYVTPDVDSGEIILQKQVPIHKDDTEDTLAARVLEQEHIAYPEAISQLAKIGQT